MTTHLQSTRSSLAKCPWLALSIVGLAFHFGACASGSAAYGSDGGDGFERASGGSKGNSEDGALPGFDDAGTGGMPLPEEMEDRGSFRAPVATGSFLWSPNPDSGRVALIDSRDATVRLLDAGLRPTHVFAVPSAEDEPTAIVQNEGSSDASLLRLAAGRVEEQRIPTPAGINRWTVSTSGATAIAWTEPEPGVSLDPTEGLQEIMVVRLDEPESDPVRLTVGYRPRAVVIGEYDERAVVISEDGMSLIDLENDIQVLRWISLGVQGGLDASVTRDTTYGLVRRAGSPRIEVISIDGSQESFTLDMKAPVTDLDLGPKGLVVAVARDVGEVLTFSMNDFGGEATSVHRTQISDLTVGSAALTDGGERAILYSTAVPEERVAVLDLLPGAHFLEHRTVSTKLAVKAISTSPNGRYAVVLGTSAEADRGGFSLVQLDQERFPRVVGTLAPVEAVAISDAGLLVTAASDSVFEAHVGRLPELTVQSFTLASRPLETGVLNDSGVGYVAQSHPEGRITFFGLKSDEVKTVSGYELSAEVIDE